MHLIISEIACVPLRVYERRSRSSHRLYAVECYSPLVLKHASAAAKYAICIRSSSHYVYGPTQYTVFVTEIYPSIPSAGRLVLRLSTRANQYNQRDQGSVTIRVFLILVFAHGPILVGRYQPQGYLFVLPIT